MLRVLELFAGIGACSKALTNLGIEHEIVDAVEIDKYAIASFNAIHGTNFEPQDITKWDKDIECDLIMHGSPCTDFSIAGKQAGGDKGSGTKSSLMYETLRIVEKLKPKYVIWENVKNLLSKKHRHNFDAYLEQMEKLGYRNHYQVLNARDYGTPQNRERIFTVSIRLDVPYCWAFKFPARRLLTKRLKDVLEPEVDEKYYLSDKQMEKINASNYDQNKRVYGVGGISPTLSTMTGGHRQPKIAEPFIVASRGREPQVLRTVRNEYGKAIRSKYESGEIKVKRSTMQQLEPRLDGCTNTLTSVQKDNYVAEPLKRRRSEYGKKVRKVYENHEIKADESMREYYVGNDGVMPTLTGSRREQKVAIKTANKTGYDLATDGDGIDLAYPDSKTRRGRVGHGVSKTLPTSDSQGVLDGYRIRKLTPLECWRLMSFDDADFHKAEKVNSNTQLYKQAGNSIVVNVLEAILEELLDGSTD